MRANQPTTTAVPDVVFQALIDLADTLPWPDLELESYTDLVTLHRALANHAPTHLSFRIAARHVADLAQQFDRALRKNQVDAQFRSAAQTTLGHIHTTFAASLTQSPARVRRMAGWSVVATWLDQLDLYLSGRYEATPATPEARPRSPFGPTRTIALGALRGRLAEIQRCGAPGVLAGDVGSEFFETVRSRAWVAAELQELAGAGVLVPTDDPDYFEFPVRVIEVADTAT